MCWVGSKFRRHALIFRLSQAHKLAYSLWCAVIFCTLCSSSHDVHAQEVFGVIELSQGSVRIVSPQGESRLAQVQDKVLEGDTIITGPGGEMQIRTEDHGFIAVRPSTKLRIDAYAARSDASDKTVMSLLVGTIR